MTYSSVGIAAALVLTLAGCGGGDDEPATAQDTPTVERTTAAPTKAPRTEAPSRCEAVDPALLTLIAGREEAGVGGMKFTRGAAVKSRDYKNVYMIAGRFDAPGAPDSVGVWAANSKTPDVQLILAVNGFAKEFTDWIDGDQSQANVTQAADGVSEARACLSS